MRDNALMELVQRRVRETLEVLGLEIVLLEVSRNRRVRVIIDREPDGVTLGDCTEANRAVLAALTGEGLDAGSFHVEVMSPGVDRLLVREKDFRRHLGRRVRVVLRRKQGGRRSFTGVLEAFAAGVLTMRPEGGREPLRFPLGEVREARLVAK